MAGEEKKKEEESCKPFNSLFVFGFPQVLRYDKRMLTIQDTLHYAPGWVGGSGRGEVYFSVRGVLCGLLICHEWRYPELYRSYQISGAELIFQSFYDGGLSVAAFAQEEGYELGSLIVASCRSNAAHSRLFLSIANCGNGEACFGGFVAAKDGRVVASLPRGRPGRAGEEETCNKQGIEWRVGKGEAGVLVTKIFPWVQLPDPAGHNYANLQTDYCKPKL